MAPWQQPIQRPGSTSADDDGSEQDQTAVASWRVKFIAHGQKKLAKCLPPAYASRCMTGKWPPPAGIKTIATRAWLCRVRRWAGVAHYPEQSISSRQGSNFKQEGTNCLPAFKGHSPCASVVLVTQDRGTNPTGRPKAIILLSDLNIAAAACNERALCGSAAAALWSSNHLPNRFRVDPVICHGAGGDGAVALVSVPPPGIRGKRGQRPTTYPIHIWVFQGMGEGVRAQRAAVAKGCTSILNRERSIYCLCRCSRALIVAPQNLAANGHLNILDLTSWSAA